MILFRYIQDKIVIIALNMMFDFLFGLLLLLYGCEITFVMLLWLFRILGMGVYYGLGYSKIKRLMHRCENTIKVLENVYLISDILPKPDTTEDVIWCELIRASCKSMNDEVFRCKQGQSAYKSYVEEWIHEIKNPVSAIKLICSNNHSEATKAVEREMEEIEYLLEQVLYYARSETLERDYFIRGFKLSDVIGRSSAWWRPARSGCVAAECAGTANRPHGSRP
jgi:hypothetical protein